MGIILADTESCRPRSVKYGHFFAIKCESKVSIVFLNVDFTLPNTHFYVELQKMVMFVQLLLNCHCTWGFSRNCLDMGIITE
jgi:hypothetical protein